MTTIKHALESAIEAMQISPVVDKYGFKIFEAINQCKSALAEVEASSTNGISNNSLEKCESETSSNVVAWINEDELPATYPYDEMFKYSKVDLVRMFPVYQPQKQYQTEFAAVIYDSHAGYGATVITAGIPHGTKLFCRENQND